MKKKNKEELTYFNAGKVMESLKKRQVRIDASGFENFEAIVKTSSS